MSVDRHVRQPKSALAQFLNSALPQRGVIAGAWARELRRGWRHGDALDCDRARLGHAFEIRVGLDLAESPGYWDHLSFLPPDECEGLLHAAGFTQSVGPDGSDFPLIQTLDPVLRCWKRKDRPGRDQTGRDDALLACYDAADTDHFAHNSRNELAVEERRNVTAFFRHLRKDHTDADRATALKGLVDLWISYVDVGRDVLLGFGDRVLLAPQLVRCYATLDLVVGRTLVEIKVQREPWVYIDETLDQVLAYVLLDRWNKLFLTDVAVYAGWEAKVLREPIDSILNTSTTGPTPELRDLREDLHAALQDDLEWAQVFDLEARFPSPPETAAPPAEEREPDRPAP